MDADELSDCLRGRFAVSIPKYGYVMDEDPQSVRRKLKNGELPELELINIGTRGLRITVRSIVAMVAKRKAHIGEADGPAKRKARQAEMADA